MNDIEGAICDECGNRIGPSGCCATVRAANYRLTIETEALKRVRDEMERVEAQLRTPHPELSHAYYADQLIEPLAALDAILKERE